MVINVTRELPMLPVTHGTGVRISVQDSESENMLPHLPMVSELIRYSRYCHRIELCTCSVRREAESGGRTLVHCVAGVSRSVTVVLAYLLRYYCPLSAAWTHVTTVRPWSNPNMAFRSQLRRWETQFYGDIS